MTAADRLHMLAYGPTWTSKLHSLPPEAASSVHGLRSGFWDPTTVLLEGTACWTTVISVLAGEGFLIEKIPAERDRLARSRFEGPADLLTYQ